MGKAVSATSAVFAAVAMLALAGCDSGEVPSPAEQLEQPRPGIAVLPEGEVELRTDGLATGSEAFLFAAGQNEVIAALTQSLGAPAAIVENSECGAGPMQFAVFERGLTVNFQDGNMVGWNSSDATGDANVAGKIQVGTDQDQTETADGYAPIQDSTLGQEFSLGPALGGFFEEGSVAMLYAGTQCFFR